LRDADRGNRASTKSKTLPGALKPAAGSLHVSEPRHSTMNPPAPRIGRSEDWTRHYNDRYAQEYEGHERSLAEFGHCDLRAVTCSGCIRELSIRGVRIGMGHQYAS
jgi:hypothetical protein